MSKHTPGPWEWSDYFNSLKGKDGAFVLWFGGNGECGGIDEGHPEGAANARLIAAAPELLAALWGLVGQIEQSREGFGIYADSPSMTEALAEAHRVHAKATGEPQ